MKNNNLITLATFLLCLFLNSGNIFSQSLEKKISGKIYYQSRGKNYPAAYKRIILMTNNKANLALAQDLYNLFDDSTVRKISGARSTLTSKEGIYDFKGVARGNYIIRVTGMGGMVIKFNIPSDNYSSKKIPDMPADYYKKISDREYVQKN